MVAIHDTGEYPRDAAISDSGELNADAEKTHASAQEAQVVKYWSDSEERKLKFKIDAVLMVCLMMGFFALQIDKANISSVITTDFTSDLGITNNIVNNGNQLQLAGIVVFEIPFNMMLSKVGAPRWMSAQILAWGSVATFQAFITNKASFYATRFLLGTFEAGYLAGSLVIIGSFYTRKEMAFRMTILYISNYLAAGTSSLIAAGVFKMDNIGGLHDWQWLFIIDGGFTMLMSIVFIFFLPGNPHDTQPAIGIRWFDMFNDREREIMSRRISLSDSGRSSKLESVSVRQVFRILCTNYLIWLHTALAFISLVPKGGLLLYAPTIVKNLGFDKIKANLLVSVTHFALILLALSAARLSDWTKLRGPVCLICTIYSLVFSGVQYHLGGSDDKWAKYAVFVVFMAGNATFQGINSAWMTLNVRDPAALYVGQALIVMGANLSGLAGQQPFRDEDAPRYTNAFVAIMALYAATCITIIGVIGVYMSKNRRVAKGNSASSANSDARDSRFAVEETRFHI